MKNITFKKEFSYTLLPQYDPLKLEKLKVLQEHILKAIEEDNINNLSNILENKKNKILENLTNTKLHAIHIAAQKNAIKCFKYLIEEKEINFLLPYSNGWVPLHFAVQAGSEKVIQYILQSKKDINIKNYKGDTALHLAIPNGNKKLTKMLISNGANINEKNDNGETPLHIATHNGYKELVSILINNDADVNIKNNMGYTSLSIAAEKGFIEIFNIIICRVTNLNEKNNYGSTALHLATSKDHIEIIKILLKIEGIDINLQTEGGFTALLIAICRNNLITTKFLLENGANPNYKNYAGYTPLILAYKKDSLEIFKIVLKYIDPTIYSSNLKFYGEFDKWFKIAEIMNDIFLSKVATNIKTLSNVEPNELEVFSKDILSKYLIKYKLDKSYFGKLKISIMTLPDNLATSLLNYLNEEDPESKNNLEMHFQKKNLQENSNLYPLLQEEAPLSSLLVSEMENNKAVKIIGEDFDL